MPDYMKFFRDRLEASKGAPGGERRRQVSLAMIEYANAKLLTPISAFTLEDLGDPFACGPAYPGLLPMAMIAAFDEGEDLQVAFDLEMQREDVVWRPMTDRERATPGQLLGLMSGSDRDEARRLLGTVFVAKAMALGGGFQMMTPDQPSAT